MKSLLIFILSLAFTGIAQAEWKIDFSRRTEALAEIEKRQEIYKEENKSILDMVTDRQSPMQDLVIIHTARGFQPGKISVKRNQRYRVHVVNIAKDNKNVSFMLDAYSQHHGTYFGEEVVFEIEPRKEGMFEFLCPETAARGQMVVYASDVPIESPLENIRLRNPASE
jgi:plastocyanin domain-containing protein